MPTRITTWLWAVAFAVLARTAIHAADPAGPDERVLRFYKVLIDRPSSGYLFDRFYNSWLESSTAEELETFLRKESAGDRKGSAEVLLALLCEREGRPVDALNHYSQALAGSTSQPDVLLMRSELHCQMLAFDLAVADLDKAIALNPPAELSARILKKLGAAHARSGDKAKAIAAWDRLVSVAAADADAREDIIELKLAEGLYEQSAEDCRALINLVKDPYKSAMLQLRLGDILQRGGKTVEALDVYQSTLPKSSADSWLEKEILAQIERLFRRQDNLAGLTNFYEKLAERFGDRPGVRRRQAAALIEVKRESDAAAVFEKLLAMTPGDRRTREQFVAMLLNAGATDRAAKAAAALAEQFPDDGTVRLLLADVQHKTGDDKAAAASVRTYLDRSDKSESAYMTAARLLVACGQHDQAAKVYDELVAAFPDSLSAIEARANGLFETKKTSEAIAALRAMARRKEIDALLRATMSLSIHGQQPVAFELLNSRRAEFAANQPFLARLYQAALGANKLDDALAVARQRVDLADQPVELRLAIADAVASGQRLDRLATIQAELESQADRSQNRSCLLAAILAEAGLLDKAAKVLADAEKAVGGDSPIIINQQYELARAQGDWRGATAALTRLIKVQPARRVLYLQWLVEIQEQAGDFEAARSWAGQWKRAAPESAEPYLVEARLCRKRDKTDEAVDVLRRAAMKFENEHVQWELAECYLAAGRIKDAARVYWLLIDRSVDLTRKLGIVQRLAMVSEVDGEGDLIARLTARAQSSPKDVFPVLALATVYQQRGDYEQRRHYLLKAAEIRADDLDLLLEIARIAEQEGDYQQMIATLTKAVELDKTGQKDAAHRLARAQLLFGDGSAGRKLLDDLLATQRLDDKAAEDIADMLITTGEPEKAMAMLTGMIASYPDNYRLAYLFAVASEEAGHSQQAIERFAALTRTRREMPAQQASAQPQGGMMAAQMAMVQGIVPDAVLGYMEMSEQTERAYSHRSQSSGRSYGHRWSGSSVTRQVALPATLEDLRMLCMCHLAKLSSGLSPDEMTGLVRRLESDGVELAEVKLRFPDGPHRGGRDVIGDMWDKRPDDANLAALWAISVFDSPGGDAKRVRKAYDTLLAKQWSQMAIISACMTVMRGGGDQTLLTDALKLLEKLDKPRPFTLMIVLQSTMMGGQMQPEAMKQMRGTLVKVLPHVPRNGPFYDEIYPMLIMFLAGGDDYGPLVKLLDEEANAAATGSLSMRGMFSFHGGNENSWFCQLPKFPPPVVPGLSPRVLAVINADPRRGGPFGPEGSLNAAKLGPQVKNVTHPLLKILLTSHCQLSDELDKLLTAELARPQPTAAGLMLAAARKADLGKPTDAMDLLLKARFLPMQRSERKWVESSIVALAGHLKSLSPTTMPAAGGVDRTAEGKAAALRLRQYGLAGDEARLLARAMMDLGLDTEADSLLTAFSPSSSAGYGPSSSSAGNSVEQLIATGKTDHAVKAMAHDIKVALRQHVNMQSFGSIGNMPSPGQYNLAGEVLKELRPADDSTSVTDWLTCGLATERIVVDDKPAHAEAVKLYRKALTISGDNRFAHLRLAMLEPAGQNLDAAWAHMLAAGRNRADAAGRLICDVLAGDQANFEQRVLLGRLALRAIEAVPQPNRASQADWMTAVLTAVGDACNGETIPSVFGERQSNMYRNSYGVGGITYVTRGSDNRLMSEDEIRISLSDRYRIFQQRRVVYLALCDGLMGVPGACEPAFRGKLRLLLTDADRVPLALLADARTVLLNSSLPSARPRLVISEDDLRLISPERLLVRHACREGSGGSPKDLDKLLEELRAANGVNRDCLNNIELLRKLYTLDGEEFLAAARAFAKDESLPAYLSIQPNLETVIQVWAEARPAKTVSIVPVVLEQADRRLAGYVATRSGWYDPNAKFDPVVMLGQELVKRLVKPAPASQSEVAGQGGPAGGPQDPAEVELSKLLDGYGKIMVKLAQTVEARTGGRSSPHATTGPDSLSAGDGQFVSDEALGLLAQYQNTIFAIAGKHPGQSLPIVLAHVARSPALLDMLGSEKWKSMARGESSMPGFDELLKNIESDFEIIRRSGLLDDWATWTPANMPSANTSYLQMVLAGIGQSDEGSSQLRTWAGRQPRGIAAILGSTASRYPTTGPDYETAVSMSTPARYKLVSKASAGLLARVRKLEPQTFGARLLVTMAEKPGEAVFGLLASELDAIRASDPRRQRDLVESVSRILDGMGVRTNAKLADGKAEQFRLFLVETMSSHTRQRIDAFLKRQPDSRSYSSDWTEAMSADAIGLIKQVWADEPELADRIFDHAVKIGRQHDSYRSYDSGSDSADCRLLKGLAEWAGKDGDLRKLIYVAKLLRTRDTSGGVWTAEIGKESFKGPLLAQVNAALRKPPTTMPDERKIYAILAALKEIASASEGQIVPAVADEFLELLGGEHNEKKERIAAWLDEPSRRDLPIFVQLRAELARSRQQKDWKKEYQRLYLQLLADESQPRSLRLALCWWGLDMDWSAHPPLLLANARLAAKADGLPQQQFASLARMLNAGVPVDAEWKSAVRPFADAWMKARSSIAGYHVMRNDDSDEVTLLKTLCRLDDREKVDRLMRTEESLKKSPAAMLALLDAGWADAAAQHLSANWRILSRVDECVITAKQRNAADEAIKLIADQDIRQLADIYFASYPMTSGVQHRLKALSDGFADLKFADKAKRTRALELLLVEPLWITHRKLLAEWAMGLALADVWAVIDGSPEWLVNQKLYAEGLVAALETGRFEEIEKVFTRFASSMPGSNRNYYAYYFLRDVGRRVLDHLICGEFERANPKVKWGCTAEQYLTLAKTMFPLLGDYDSDMRREFASTMQSLHFLAGKEAKEAKDWLAAQKISESRIHVGPFEMAFRSSPESEHGRIIEALAAAAKYRNQTPESLFDRRVRAGSDYPATTAALKKWRQAATSRPDGQRGNIDKAGK